MTEKKTSNTTSEEFDKLSIQVSLNGLSFCVLDTLRNTIKYSDSIVFEKERTPYGLQKGLVALFERHGLAKKHFSDVIAVHRNNLFSLVPKSLFEEAEMANYLKFNTKILATDHIAYDDIGSFEMANVYVPFVNVNNYIYELFGEFTFKHSGTVMIETLLTGNNKESSPVCYVHLDQHYMEITVISKKKLLLYNSYHFTTNEDFIYYLLFTLEQLALDTETVILKLFGTIEEDNALYKLCYKYVKHISIFVPTTATYPFADSHQESIDFTVLNSL